MPTSLSFIRSPNWGQIQDQLPVVPWHILWLEGLAHSINKSLQPLKMLVSLPGVTVNLHSILGWWIEVKHTVLREATTAWVNTNLAPAARLSIQLLRLNFVLNFLNSEHEKDSHCWAIPYTLIKRTAKGIPNRMHFLFNACRRNENNPIMDDIWYPQFIKT